MNVLKLAIRVFTPPMVVSLYYALKFGAKISPRSEVDISGNLSLGKKCVVGSFTKIKAFNGPIVIGDRGGIATGCFLSSGEGGLRIGRNFICGPNVTIVASNYAHSDLEAHLEDQGVTSKGIKIGNNVWIGANSTLLDGAVIGDNTIIVANSLVNRRYPPNVILQGAPAKVIFKRT